MNEEIKEIAKELKREYFRNYQRTMTPEQKAKKRAQEKAWRLKNKDKVEQHRKNYWIRKAEKVKEEQRHDG